MNRLVVLMRYAIVGALGAITQTGVLYLWISVLHLEETYILGVVIGFCLALALTFSLQKWWTFKDDSTARTRRQFIVYTAIALVSVALNAGLLQGTKTMFDIFNIDFFQMWYLIAEVVIVALVAFLSFFANRVLTFPGSNRPKSIVLIGASGLVGSEIVPLLRACRYRVIAPTHHELDITNEFALRAFLQKHVPTHVINMAALLNVNDIESDPEPARRLNAIASESIVRILAEEHIGAHYIFMSTSYVLREDSAPQGETSATEPVNAYGTTKAEGEKLIENTCVRFSIPYIMVRTSWIYGFARETFVDEVVKKLQSGEAFLAATDQVGNLTSAHDLAEALVSFVTTPRASGIYHVFNNDERGVSRFDIARDIADFLNIPPAKVMAGTREDIFKGGKRPSIILLNTKLPPLRDWREALHEYLEERYGTTHVSR